MLLITHIGELQGGSGISDDYVVSIEISNDPRVLTYNLHCDTDERLSILLVRDGSRHLSRLRPGCGCQNEREQQDGKPWNMIVPVHE